MATPESRPDKPMLDDCGCCEPDIPEYRIDNRPGLPGVAFHLATQARFRRHMLARLSRWTLPDGERAGERPLSRLSTREPDDPAIALLDAWATLADVLSFYQERLANEAWLRTAGERRSILELARSIGYELNPGVAASTWLAFDVDDSDATPDETTVRAGTQVQSIPTKEDELPQTFETGEDFVVHASWNRLRPRQRKSQHIRIDTRTLWFDGLNTGLRPGGRLLFIAAGASGDPGHAAWDLRRITHVETEAVLQRTRVEVDAGRRRMDGDFEILALRERAAIFGHNAPDWSGLSRQVRADYLGLAGVDDLDDVDTGEWPDFTIFAPAARSAAERRFRVPTEVDARQVADAALAAAEVQARALNHAAAAATPETLIALGRGIASLAGEIARAGGEQLQTLKSLFPTDADAVDDSPLAIIATHIAGILTDLLQSVGLKPPDLQWPGLTATDNWLEAATDIAAAINASMREFIVQLSGVTTLSFDLSGLNTRLTAIGVELNRLREANPLLLPFDILDSVQSRLVGVFRQAADNAEAVASAVAAGALAQLLRGVIETEMLQAPDARRLATVTRFALEVARYGAALDAPRRLFADLDDDIASLDFTRPEALPSLLQARLNDGPGLPEDDEQRLALATALGVSALGAGGVAAVTTVGLGLPAGMAALGAGLVPLVLMGDSVRSGVEQIAGAVESAVEKALAVRSRTIVGHRPVFARDGFRVDLAARHPAIGPDAWACLESDGDQALVWISESGETSRAGYLLSGEVTRLTLDAAEGVLARFETRVRETRVHAVGERLSLAEIVIDSPVAGREIALETPLTTLPSPGAAVIVRGTGVDGQPHAELAWIERAEAGRLLFQHALVHRYHRDTLEILLNVVAASHGGSVIDEVLGSGDGARTFQRFKLRKPPLTFVSAATPSGARSSLSLRVDGVEWEQVASLYGRGPDERVYTLRLSDDGDAYIRFGDGITGARLPTGQENVTVSYRSGIGFAGEVGAGSLTLLKKRPFGVKAVSNPLPASGADEPERLEDARRNAPLTVLTLDRIVSLQDFEDFARAYAGIGKASAVPLWHGEQELVHISIADASGNEIAESSALFRNLRAAIEQARDPLREVMLASFARRSFALEAAILRDPARRWEDIEAAARAALSDAFAFAQRGFGQPVTSAEIIEVLHAIDGVVAVDIDKLYRLDIAGRQQGGDFSSVLPAAPARVANGGFLPAELLLIDASGITLKEMKP